MVNKWFSIRNYKCGKLREVKHLMYLKENKSIEILEVTASETEEFVFI